MGRPTVKDGIDESGLSTVRPAKIMNGRTFYESDTMGLRLADETAAAWSPIICVPFTYDVSGGDDGAVGAHAISGATIPAGCVILDGVIDVITTFTSAADSATIAISVEAANDIVSAVAISDGANPWDAGLKDVVPSGSAANSKKTTAARTVTVTVGVQALTAGKLRGFLRCLRSRTT